MQLVIKFVASLIGVMVVVLGFHATTRIQREIALFERDTARDHRAMGKMLAASIQWSWRSQGEAAAEQLAEEANHWSTVEIAWHWLDQRSGPAGTTSGLTPARLDRLRRTHDTWWIEPQPEGPPVLRSAVLVAGPGGRTGWIDLRESLRERSSYVRESVVRTVVTIGILVALCAVVSVLLGMWLVGRPVRRMIDQARRVGEGDFSGRLVLRQRDELADLAGALNSMAVRLARTTTEREAALEQLRHADRLRTVGELASGVAHELGTPLHVIAARARSIQKGRVTGQAVLDAAAAIGEQAERISTIIRQLLDFARHRSLKVGPTDLVLAVRQTLALLDPLARKAGVCCTVEAASETMVAQLDRGLFQQALTNLVVNGIQAMPAGGALAVALTPAPTGGWTIEVRDEGVGIAPEVLPAIFDPFFTTKEVSEGTGLGLSVVHGIVEEHGGSIQVRSEPGRGSSFLIHLPAEKMA